MCAGRQALYRLNAEGKDILKGCSTNMCQQAWLPDGIGLRDFRHTPSYGASQMARGNVVARRHRNKIRKDGVVERQQSAVPISSSVPRLD